MVGSAGNFIWKFGTVLEEADESAYWMELLIDAGKARSESTSALLRKANEPVAISVSSINMARKSGGGAG
jgi:cellobiose-specific phosphotransferase system component IIA